MKTFKRLKARDDAIKNLKEIGFRRNRLQCYGSDYESFLRGRGDKSELLLVDFYFGRFVWEVEKDTLVTHDAVKCDDDPRYCAILNALYEGEVKDKKRV